MEELLEHGMPIIKSIAFAIVVFVVGLFLIKWLTNKITNFVNKKEMDTTLKPFIISASNITLKIILMISIISILGIDTTALAAVLASAGLAIGLAFQGSLSNFAGGLLLLFIRPIKVGDYIEANGFGGTVEGIKILYTEIVTPDNKVVFIPNGTLSNASIVNYSMKDTRRVDLIFNASYDADSDQVFRILNDIVNQEERILSLPEPFIRMLSHGDSAVNYTVRVWVNKDDYWMVYYDLMERVKKEFERENIAIPYPQVEVHVNK